MKRSFQLLQSAAFAVLVCGTALHPASAQSTLNGSTPEPVLQEADANDRDFVKALGQAVANEGAVAGLALKRSASAEVRSVAKVIRSDRRRAHSDLAYAASGAGFVPPDDPDAAERVLETDLRAKSGPEFDRAFLQRIIQMDQTALDLTDREITDGFNPHIVSFAKYRKTLIAAELGNAQDALQKLRN